MANMFAARLATSGAAIEVPDMCLAEPATDKSTPAKRLFLFR
jgi:hypothetical protein